MKYIIYIFLLVPSTLGATKTLTVQEMFTEAENKNQLPIGILSAIAYVESSHNHRAFVKKDGKGDKSSYGLLQIQLASARQMGFKGKPKDLMQPSINIEYGSAYLKWLLDITNNDYAKALGCWNAGPYSQICRSNKYGTYAGKVFNAWIRENNKVKEEEL